MICSVAINWQNPHQCATCFNKQSDLLSRGWGQECQLRHKQTPSHIWASSLCWRARSSVYLPMLSVYKTTPSSVPSTGSSAVLANRWKKRKRNYFFSPGALGYNTPTELPASHVKLLCSPRALCFLRSFFLTSRYRGTLRSKLSR